MVNGQLLPKFVNTRTRGQSRSSRSVLSNAILNEVTRSKARGAFLDASMDAPLWLEPIIMQGTLDDECAAHAWQRFRSGVMHLTPQIAITPSPSAICSRSTSDR